MPRNYTRRSRRTRRRRTPWYRRKYDAMSLAAKAAKGVWYLKGLVNSEMLHSQGIVNTTIPNTGSVVLLNGLSQNDTASGRTGNSVLMRNISLRMFFTQASAAVTTQYRVMLFWDTQQVADSVPTTTTVLESTSVLSPLATASIGRFKVIKSWIFSTDDTKTQTRFIECYKQFRIHTKFNGTANTDIQKNGLYLLILSDQATNVPTIDYSYKVGYHDN